MCDTSFLQFRAIELLLDCRDDKLREMLLLVRNWICTTSRDSLNERISSFKCIIEDTCANCARMLQSAVITAQEQMTSCARMTVYCAQVLDMMYDCMFYSDVDGFAPLFPLSVSRDICADTWHSCIYTIVAELEHKPHVQELLSRGDKYFVDQVFDLYATQYRDANVCAVERARKTLIGFCAMFEPCSAMPRCDTTNILREIRTFNETVFQTVLEQMRAQMTILDHLREYRVRWVYDRANVDSCGANYAFVDDMTQECSMHCAHDFAIFLEDHLKLF